MVANALRGPILVQSPRRNSDDAGIGRYRRRDTQVGRVSGPFNHLTSATRRIHSAGVPRKAQIPSRASTCPVASFLESWPGWARGRARIFKAGGRFLLNCCSIRRRGMFSFFSCLLFSQNGNEDTTAMQQIRRIPLKSIVFECWLNLPTTGCTFPPVVLYKHGI